MKCKNAVGKPSRLRSLFWASCFIGSLNLSFSLTQPAMAAGSNNAVPVVNTNISVAKTGSEPFDSKTWNGDLSTAGYDESEDNQIVRLQDSITYLVEVSVNDNDVQSLTTTVQLDKKQAWIKVPTGCKTDPNEVNPISSISADKRTLFCNLGPAIEGTTRAIYPTARAIAASYDGQEITLNDHHVSATVASQADGISNTATDGPTDVTVTANFRVNTVKELQVTALDPVTGKPLYIAPAHKGADGTTKGSVVEYVIKVKYEKGSMLANAPNEAAGDFEQDYQLLDHYTDDNNNNSKTVTSSSGVPITVSTGAVLYTWDPKKPACELVGNHGPNASVSCTQINHILDQTGPQFVADGINDPNIAIDLQNIDVRDPDNDSNLVELRINIWYSEPTDIATHQGCPPYPCTSFTVNSVGVYDTSGSDPSVLGFNPVSTEDAAGNNLLNYNGTGEPFPDYVPYPLNYAGPGSWTASKGFDGTWVPNKTGTREYALGATIPFLLNIWDYRFVDGAKSQLCEKIDTTQFEYVGLSAPNRNDMTYSWNNNMAYNPNVVSYGPTQSIFADDKQGLVSYLYSDEQHVGLLAQRDDTCDDDVNADGKFVLDGVNQISQLPDTPNDWVTDPKLLGGAAKVTKLRMQAVIDKAYLLSLDPASTRMAFATNHLLKIKPTATGYTNATTGVTYLPNYMTSRIDNAPNPGWGAWKNISAVSINPDDVSFSFSDRDADRVILVPSSIGLEKYTEPRGLKVVRSNDHVQFILKPQVLGSWNPAITTAGLVDSLPVGTDYLLGSERFSVDGGTTWLTRSAYDAANPAVTISSAANTNLRSLNWVFDSVNTGDQLPLIRYEVVVDPKLTSGTFINTATLTSDIGTDSEDADTASDPVHAKYQLNILASSGLDVFKTVDYPVHGMNEPFEFELIYTNLGAEDYSSGDFIDILPYHNDGSGQASSGLASTRRPSSKFSGIYSVTKITAAHNEVFSATNAAHSTVQQDVCHESNQAAGYIPAQGDLCYLMYVNNNNKFAGGSATGTGTTTWTPCTSLAPLVCGALTTDSITGLRFTTPALTGASGGKSVRIQLSPVGNIGGVPSLDESGKVTEASTGDIYTNNFGGRVPELSLQVISNDASVTIVPSTIGDRVWLDTNQNGLQDTGEQGISGVEVKLTCGTASVTTTTLTDLASTTANEAGLYQFSGLPGGNAASVLTPGQACTLSIDPSQAELAAYLLTTPNVGGNTSNDRVTDISDSDGTLDGNSVVINFTADSTGQDNQGFDFGFKSNLSLGNYVWYDLNMDGIQTANEAGVGQVEVLLYANASCTGSSVANTTSSQTGWYEFKGLAAGAYCLQFNTPAGWSLSPANVGVDALDSDAVATSTTSQYLIKDINLAADDFTQDIGIFHAQCTAPILPIGIQAQIPVYGSSPWHHPSAHNVKAGDLNMVGFCLEKPDADPAEGDLLKVTSTDRQSLSAARVDYLKRLFTALGDTEVLATINAEFGSSTQNLDSLLQSLVWYYTDWNEDFTKVEQSINDTAWASTQKAAMKTLGQLILDRTAGTNGQTQYALTEVYWLHNLTDTGRQDLIVPSNYVFPDEQCTLPKLVDIELSKTLDKSTAKRGDSLVYELAVTNKGPSDATAIKVTEALPAGVSLDTAIAPVAQQGGYDTASGIWDVGNLSVGQTVTLKITVKVD